MFEGLKVILLIPVFDEEVKIEKVLQRVPHDVVDEVLVIDDGSRDRSPQVAVEHGATLFPLGRTFGVGAALRAGYRYARAGGYDIAVVIAGNNKDAPEEITRLLEPIASNRADFVQGSRWLQSDADLGEMPAYRRVATRLHPLLFSLVARRRISDSTNGYRACRVSILDDPDLDLAPSWLDTYELEPYLFLRVIALGYRVCEVPVSKIYPPRELGQTKMRPIVDWWRILRPVVRAAFSSAGTRRTLTQEGPR